MSECRENHRVKAFGRLKKKSDVRQVAEAYMLKRDHPNSKATEFRQPGHRSRNAAKLTESKPFYSDVEQAAEAYMLKRDHPNSKATEFRQPGIEVGMPRNSPSQSVWPFVEERVKAFLRLRKKYDVEQVAEAYMLKRDQPNSKATEFRQPGHRFRNAAKLTESKRFAVCGRIKAFRRLQKKSDVEQVAEAYMLKRDHPNSKATEFRQPGQSKSECRETHRVKAFGRLRKTSVVGQVAEAYILQRDHPKFKGKLNFGNRGIEDGMPRNSPSQSLSPFEEESECRETHRVKVFHRLRKKYDAEQVAEAYMLKRDHPNSKATEFRQPGHRSRNAAKLTESKRLAVCGRTTVASKSECRETHRVKVFHRLRKKYDAEQVAEAYMLKRDHPNSKATEFRQPRHRSRNAAKLTESKRFAVCGSCLMYNKERKHTCSRGITRNSKSTEFQQPGIEVGIVRNSHSQSISPFA
ncbi:hypothetical protein D5086_033958 [Populus alba]|uniref:Uncharacterized protein n=1 Tax=Populus alba TaxID=43335 RepID=A0ACC4AJ64_POPAL